MVEATGLEIMALRSLQRPDLSAEFHKNMLIDLKVGGTQTVFRSHKPPLQL
jgi:hypothetical protein